MSVKQVLSCRSTNLQVIHDIHCKLFFTILFRTFTWLHTNDKCNGNFTVCRLSRASRLFCTLLLRDVENKDRS